MCGIIGISNFNGLLQEPTVTAMAIGASLVHRGPDGEGFVAFSTNCSSEFYSHSRQLNFSPQCILGHRRLSIIDIDGGQQPILNKRKTSAVVVNGEIYNHVELRAELEAKGHIFTTNSDSEVILHLYEEIGTDCFNKLNGMFACAIWDNTQQRLILGRDRFGQKPLYYSTFNGEIAFASELKALLKHPLIESEIDQLSLSQYMAYEYVPVPRSIYKNICKLSAGSFLAWMPNTQPVVKSYWDYDIAEIDYSISEQEAATQMTELLEQSVKRRLMSDVPLGVFLSGGLDSSAVAAMASRHALGRVKTFSIGFDDQSFDESSYARIVASHLGTEHYEKRFHTNELFETIDQILSNLDEPMADASLLPTYLLSKFAREHVTVALGGDGSDELLCGYPTFPAHKAASLYRALIPAFLHHKAIVPAVSALPVSHTNMSFDFKAKQFLKGVLVSPEISQQQWLGAFSPTEMNDLLKNNGYSEDDIYGPSIGYYKSPNGADLHNRLSHLYCKTYLQDDILTKVDRASMAVSLEVRAPFLDKDLVEYIGHLPSKYKIKGFNQTKYILKKAVRNLIPEEIINRPKKGFGIPIGQWFKNELKECITDNSFTEKLSGFGIRKESVNTLVDQHLKNKRDNRKQLWTLYTLTKAV